MSDRRRLRIVLPGGSGQVGSALARAFHASGHDVVVLSRRPRPALWRVVPWDGATRGAWCREVNGSDAVINLAGRSVNCRYTPANRRAIVESRVQSTRAVGEAIARSVRPPGVWLQMSTATIYAHRFDAPNDEATGVIGGGEPDAPATWGFSIEVARAWEAAFEASRTPDTRRVLLRSAVVMTPDRGGIFDTLLSVVREGLGGTQGDGRQFVSWIHRDDFVGAMRWLIDRPDIEGVMNVAAPRPLPNAAFMRALRDAAGVPVGLPLARWMLRVGAMLKRTETELLLKSRRVVPGRLLAHGFAFRYEAWPEAARDLCREWQQRRTMGGG